MARSMLAISIDSGPKRGETLKCKPGDLIHIGRVVRGNTLAIKDPSISQKHLSIRFLSEVTVWAVTDLGSSNGTYLNDALISRDDPTPLTDGDVIQIGCRTSISVHIFDQQAGPLPLPRCRGPPIPNKAVTLDEEKETKPGKIEGKRTVRGRKNNALQRVVTENRTGMVTRASARTSSTSVSGVKAVEDISVVISDPESADELVKEMPNKKRSIGAEKEGPSKSGEKEQQDDKGEGNWVNLTMGEWFDRMEECLPKAINKFAEGIIANLREKSSRFDEFVAQASNVIHD